jgi:hypothetical protein
MPSKAATAALRDIVDLPRLQIAIEFELANLK